MIADVLMNFLNMLRKRDKIGGCGEHFITFTTGACRSGSALFAVLTNIL